jgi:hypothetical protein
MFPKEHKEETVAINCHSNRDAKILVSHPAIPQVDCTLAPRSIKEVPTFADTLAPRSKREVPQCCFYMMA